jgi:hypothetical protein
MESALLLHRSSRFLWFLDHLLSNLFGQWILLHRVFQGGKGCKLDAILFRYFDICTSLRIARLASFSDGGLKRSKAIQGNWDFALKCLQSECQFRRPVRIEFATRRDAQAFNSLRAAYLRQQ